MIAFLSKDVLQDKSFVRILEVAQEEKIPIILIHSPSDCLFPSNQPDSIKKIFSTIAVRLIEGFAKESWHEIERQLQHSHFLTKEEDVSTDIFLSHRQLTGQKIALSLHTELKGRYKVFLDVKTKFVLHDLEKLVGQTRLFVFILTEGIFASTFCFLGNVLLAIVKMLRI